uniref:Uncharacterized protein n=1 Tax=Serratia marcescens TaxID=615 RepID=A0A345IPR9_SERMA|nr:hypothetical protein [Serratia marcescens]
MTVGQRLHGVEPYPYRQHQSLQHPALAALPVAAVALKPSAYSCTCA